MSQETSGNPAEAPNAAGAAGRGRGWQGAIATPSRHEPRPRPQGSQLGCASPCEALTSRRCRARGRVLPRAARAAALVSQARQMIPCPFCALQRAPLIRAWTSYT
jgi:hypothetical protein